MHLEILAMDLGIITKNELFENLNILKKIIILILLRI